MPAPSGATPTFAFPYLLESDVPDVATASEDLALAIETVLIPVAAPPSGSVYATGSVGIPTTFGAIAMAVDAFLKNGMTQGSGGLIVPTTGIYQVNLQVCYNNTGSSGVDLLVGVLKNGTLYRHGVQIYSQAASQYPAATCSTLVSCSVGDLIQAGAVTSAGGIIGGASGEDNYLDVALVSF